MRAQARFFRHREWREPLHGFLEGLLCDEPSGMVVLQGIAFHALRTQQLFLGRHPGPTHLFAADMVKINPTAILERSGLANVRSL